MIGPRVVKVTKCFMGEPSGAMDSGGWRINDRITQTQRARKVINRRLGGIHRLRFGAGSLIPLCCLLGRAGLVVMFSDHPRILVGASTAVGYCFQPACNLTMVDPS